jgi:CubicO group peptidase (beta-lactamase class C family)
MQPNQVPANFFITLVSILLLLFSCDMGRPPARIMGPGERLAEIHQGGYEEAIQDFDLPGLSIAVLDAGQVIWLESFGVSNLETGLSNNPDRLHRLGEISQTFVSFALHKLENEGALSLGDPLVRFFPETEGTYLQSINLRHILSHSSGIVASAWDSLEGDPLHYRNSLEYALDSPPLFDPGERFSFSWIGYDILGLVIEEVTGQNFASYMDNEVVAPLGMAPGGFTLEGKTIVPGHDWGRTFEEIPYSLPSRGMVGSLNQLSDFILKLSDIYYGQDKGPWNKEDLDSIRGYHNAELLWPSGHYFGLGSMITGHRFESEGPVLGKEGHTYGSAAGFYYLPENDLGIAFLSNNLGVPVGLTSSWVLQSLLDIKNLRRIRRYEPEIRSRASDLRPLNKSEIAGRYYGEDYILDIQNGEETARLIRLDPLGIVLRSEVKVTDRQEGFFFLEGDFGRDLEILEAKIYGLGNQKIIYSKYQDREDYFMSAGTREEAVTPNPDWAGIYSLASGPKTLDESNPLWSSDLMLWLGRDDLILDAEEEGVFLHFERDNAIKGAKRAGLATADNRIIMGGYEIARNGFFHGGPGQVYQLSLEDGTWILEYQGLKFRQISR